MYVALVITDVKTDEYRRSYAVHDQLTGFSSSQRHRFVSFLQRAIQTVSLFHPTSYQNCAGKCFTGVKRSERHSNFSHRLISTETNYAKLHWRLQNCQELCVISGFRLEVDEIFTLLRYYAAYGGNSLPAFRDNLSALSTKVKIFKKTIEPWPLNMVLIGCPETSVPCVISQQSADLKRGI